MSNINESIFKAYDIRGVYPEEINEEAVFKIAAAFVEFLNPAKVVVARDSRMSSDTLRQSVITAISASGADVIDIGMIPTPLFYFAVSKLNASGGIMVTASHNPSQYNGLKIVREKAIPVSQEDGLLQLKNLAKKIEVSRIRKGKVQEKDLINDYVNFLVAKSGLKGGEIKLNVGVDKRGIVNNVLTPLLENLAIIPDQEADIKFGFDVDGDRMGVSQNGKIIRADMLAGIIIQDTLERKSFVKKILKPGFVCDVRFSRAIAEYVSKRGGKIIRSRVGHPFIKKAMRKNKAVFGAEFSGHFYFKETFSSEASILMMLKILKIMQRTGKSIWKLIEPFNKYFHSGEINLELGIRNYELWEEIVKKLKENYKDGKVDEFDGITVEYPSTSLGTSWWFNLRPSNTELVLRLVVEADTQYILDQRIKELTATISQFSA